MGRINPYPIRQFHTEMVWDPGWTLMQQQPPSRWLHVFELCGAPGGTRTPGLLVRSQELTQNQQLSRNCNGCALLLIIVQIQQLTGHSALVDSNPEQRFYAGGGHKNGHSRSTRDAMLRSAIRS